MGSGGLQMLAREALDGYWCYFTCVARACYPWSGNDPRHVRTLSVSSTRIGSIRSDAWCASKLEMREEGLEESGRSHGEGGWKVWRYVTSFFAENTPLGPDF